MISDEERREVARRLRGQAKKLGPNMDAHEFAHYTADVIDVNECMTWYEMELRLADLIEPSCDRDALLTEVKELEKCAWYFGLDFDEDEPLRDRLKEASEDFAGCARRIREALGVSDD